MASSEEKPTEMVVANQTVVPAPKSRGCCARNPYTPIARYTIFWMSVTSSAFLIAGMFAPGWLRLYGNLKLNTGTSYTKFYYQNAYQDYGLWTVTQCKREYDYKAYICSTRSYNVLQSQDQSSRMAEIEVANEGYSDRSFDGIALYFTYTTMWVLQTVYVLGTFAAVCYTYLAFDLCRRKATNRFCNAVSEQNAIALGILPASIAIIPVLVFGLAITNTTWSKEDHFNYRDSDVTLYGIIFGGMGASILFLYTLFMLCYTRICTCPPEEIGEAERKLQEENMDEENGECDD